MRILYTGARDWMRVDVVDIAMRQTTEPCHSSEVTVVQGGAKGLDEIVRYLAERYGFTVETHWAKDHPSPKARNQHMVNLGADLCQAFALKWASGTGHCARAARKAGIPAIDYGVDTS